MLNRLQTALTYWENLQVDTKAQIIGGFFATLVGVYVSMRVSNKQQGAREETQNEAVFLSALQHLGMELSFNEDIFRKLSEGLRDIPHAPRTIHGNIRLLVEHSRDAMSAVFNNTILSGTVHKLQKNDELFNALHHAYFNMMGSGFSLLPILFENTEDHDQAAIDVALEAASNKVKTVLETIKRAKSLVEVELKERKIALIDPARVG